MLFGATITWSQAIFSIVGLGVDEDEDEDEASPALSTQYGDSPLSHLMHVIFIMPPSV